MTAAAIPLTAAMESAKKVIADSISCIVAGAASEVTEPILAYLARTGRHGSTPVLGTARAEVRIDKLPGSPDQPLTWEEVHNKFKDCYDASGIEADRSQAAWALLPALKRCADVSQLSSLLTVPR